VFHRLEERVKAHVLICMLAAYLTWHLRRAWAPLTFTGQDLPRQDPPRQDNPVAPAGRSAHAQAKASCQHDPVGRLYRSFCGLLAHLATLPATMSGSPAPPSPCPCSPSPPPPSGRPSTFSAPRSRSP
jgi:hypothetical protein